MASTTTNTVKDNNDPYTGTEYQHDFGKVGFGVNRIKNNKSQAYRNYVDDKHLWNLKTENRDDWAFSDEGLVKYKLKRDRTPTPADISKSYLRSLTQDDSPHTIHIKKGKNRNDDWNTYKVTVVNQNRANKYGAELYDQLGIADKSLTVIDTDQVISKF